MSLFFDDLVMSPNMIMDEELFDYWREWIKQASHFEMAVVEKFAPGGHVLFRHGGGLDFLFLKKFESLGGMTKRISEKIGVWQITDFVNGTITMEQFKEIMSRE